MDHLALQSAEHDDAVSPLSLPPFSPIKQFYVEKGYTILEESPNLCLIGIQSSPIAGGAYSSLTSSLPVFPFLSPLPLSRPNSLLCDVAFAAGIGCDR